MDPLLARIPLEWPRRFVELPPEEQAWRGRVFLVAYIASGAGGGGHIAFAWNVAFTPNREASEVNRRFVEEIGDDAIREGLDNI
jgi:hypothetical protein